MQRAAQRPEGDRRPLPRRLELLQISRPGLRRRRRQQRRVELLHLGRPAQHLRPRRGCADVDGKLERRLDRHERRQDDRAARSLSARLLRQGLRRPYRRCERRVERPRTLDDERRPRALVEGRRQGHAAVRRALPTATGPAGALMRNAIGAALVLLLFAASADAADRIRIGFPELAVQFLPLPLGEKRGFFKEEGLQAEFIRMTPPVALAALTAGKIDYYTAIGPGVAATIRGVAVKAVAGFTTGAPFVLVARPEYKAVADLRGKAIAINTYGSPLEVGGRLIVKHFRLDPDKEVKFLATGLFEPRLEEAGGKELDFFVGIETEMLDDQSAADFERTAVSIDRNRLAPEIGDRFIFRPGDQHEGRAGSEAGDGFDGDSADCRRYAGADRGVVVDLSRRQRRESDGRRHTDELRLQSFLFEEAAFLSERKRQELDGKLGEADSDSIRRVRGRGEKQENERGPDRVSHQCASGSGRSWKCTANGCMPLPPSFNQGARSPLVVQSPRPFHPAFASSIRPSKPLA